MGRRDRRADEDEARITAVEAVWLANPSIGCRWKMRRPIVRTIRQPPIAVPSVSVAPAGDLDPERHGERVEVAARDAAAPRSTPIAFWASLAPWLNESAADIDPLAGPHRLGQAARRAA